jgi:hypothetical protein
MLSGSQLSKGGATRLVAGMSSAPRGYERHDHMDEKNDHSCKHRQRHSFVNGRATNRCYAFLSFPLIQTAVVQSPTCC